MSRVKRVVRQSKSTQIPYVSAVTNRSNNYARIFRTTRPILQWRVHKLDPQLPWFHTFSPCPAVDVDTGDKIHAPQLMILEKSSDSKQPILHSPILSLRSKTMDQSKWAISTQRKWDRLWDHPLFKPLPHQEEMLQRFGPKMKQVLEDPYAQEAFLLQWTMGSGKSQGSLYPTSQIYVPNIVILCVNTMIETWVQFVHSLPQLPCGETVVEILGLTEFSRVIESQPTYLRNKYVIFDEGHTFRRVTEAMEWQLRALREAKILISLTGTPLVNDRTDLIGLGTSLRYDFSPMERNMVEDVSIPSFHPDMFALVDRIFTDRIHYYDPGQENTAYPPTQLLLQPIPMSWPQTIDYLVNRRKMYRLGDDKNIYLEIDLGHRNCYNSFQRRFANMGAYSGPNVGAEVSTSLSPKMERVVLDTLANGSRQIIYSNFLPNGIVPIYEAIHKAGTLRVRLVTGHTEEPERDEVFTAYNNGDLDVLCMSCIGGVGLSFKETRYLRLLESFENLPMEMQCIARIARYKSHKKNPDAVQVIKYISTFPPLPCDDEQGEDYFYTRYCIPKWGTKEEIWVNTKTFQNIITYQIQEEEGGQTIDEKLQLSNQHKQEQLHPILQRMAQLGQSRFGTQVVIDTFPEWVCQSSSSSCSSPLPTIQDQHNKTAVVVPIVGSIKSKRKSTRKDAVSLASTTTTTFHRPPTKKKEWEQARMSRAAQKLMIEKAQGFAASA